MPSEGTLLAASATSSLEATEEEEKQGRGAETEFPFGSTQISTLLSRGCASTTNLRAGIFTFFWYFFYL
jgi:hypothetical protein